MTRVDQISNGNEKLSSRELMYLNRLAKNKEFVKRFSKFDLRKIKKNLQKQLSAYLRRRDISRSRKDYIQLLTKRAVDNIQKIIGNNSKGKDILRGQERVKKLNELKRKVDNIFKVDNSFLGKIKRFFRTSLDNKMMPFNEGLRKIIKGGKDLSTFQEYAKLKGWYHKKVDGKWGDSSIIAFSKYLESKGISYKEFEKWVYVSKKKIYEMDKILHRYNIRYDDLFGKNSPFYGEREQEIMKDAEKIGYYEQFLKYERKYKKDILHMRGERVDKKYKRLYLRSLDKIRNYPFPKEGLKLVKKFNSVSYNDVLKDIGYNFRAKNLIKRYFPRIKENLIGGAMRALRNFHHKYRNINVSKIPVTVNVPLAIMKGGRRQNASLSFTYDPKTGKVHTEVFSYSFHIPMRNRDKGTPLGTHIINIRSSIIGKSINTPISPTGHVVYGFRITKQGIDKGLNTNSSGRGILTHSVSRRRINMIKSGYGTTTWGCTVYPDMDVARIYKKNKSSKYVIEETTYPVV